MLDLNTRELAAPILSSRPLALVTLSLSPRPLYSAAQGPSTGGHSGRARSPCPRSAAPPLGLSWPRARKPLQGWHRVTLRLNVAFTGPLTPLLSPERISVINSFPKPWSLSGTTQSEMGACQESKWEEMRVRTHTWGNRKEEVARGSWDSGRWKSRHGGETRVCSTVLSGLSEELRWVEAWGQWADYINSIQQPRVKSPWGRCLQSQVGLGKFWALEVYILWENNRMTRVKWSITQDVRVGLGVWLSLFVTIDFSKVRGCFIV